MRGGRVSGRRHHGNFRVEDHAECWAEHRGQCFCLQQPVGDLEHNGASCSGANCGSLSSTGPNKATYTAPAAVSSPLAVTLQASLPGTSSSKTIAVTVNPALAIASPPPAGTVGISYSTELSAGGTPPVQVTQVSSTLPPGLTYSASTSVVSGTPTTPGTFSSVLQATDASDVPANLAITETFVILAASTGSGGGTGAGNTLAVIPVKLPAGLAGTSYTTYPH